MQRFPLVGLIAARVADSWRRLAVFVQAKEGVSTVEYALITIAVISIVGGAIGLLSGSFDGLFNDLSNELADAQNAAKTAGGT